MKNYESNQTEVRTCNFELSKSLKTFMMPSVRHLINH